MFLELTNVAKFWGADLLFDQVSGYIDDGQIIGLVGNNGVGKTTFCNIITGHDAEYDGIVKLYPGVKTAYFRQMPESIGESSQSVFEYILTSQEHVLEVERQYHQFLNKLQQEEATPSLLEEFGSIQEQYDLLGAADLIERIEAVLNGLGISENGTLTTATSRAIGYHSKLSELSGGERKIVELAIILLNKEANLLILDEPTNHLDLEARAWLELFIRGFKGSVIIVSHDRHLLNKVADQIWEIADYSLSTYKGNYDQFEKQKKANREALLHHVEIQQKELARLEAIVSAYQKNIKNGGSYVTTKLYNATKSRIERFKINMTPPPPPDRADLKLSLQNATPKGYTVLRLNAFSFGYNAERTLIDSQTLTLTKESKLALLGGNGTGKSTLIKLILTKYCYLHSIDPHVYGIADFYKRHLTHVKSDEAFYLGPGITIGYYSQHHNQLPTELTIRQHLWNNDIKDESQFQSIIRRYHFTKDTVDNKKIGDLSGGEKSKLQFIMLMLTGANTLLLDEPINHLDIDSMKIVEQVLHDFQGALLVISHDQYFLQRVVNGLLVLKDKALTVFNESIDEYLAKKKKVG